MPEASARAQILTNMLQKEPNDLKEKDIKRIAGLLEGYSAADITNLVKEAAMEAIREFQGNHSMLISSPKYMIRAISVKDLEKATKTVRPSLDRKTLQYYIDWEKKLQNMN